MVVGHLRACGPIEPSRADNDINLDQQPVWLFVQVLAGEASGWRALYAGYAMQTAMLERLDATAT